VGFLQRRRRRWLLSRGGGAPGGIARRDSFLNFEKVWVRWPTCQSRLPSLLLGLRHVDGLRERFHSQDSLALFQNLPRARTDSADCWLGVLIATVFEQECLQFKCYVVGLLSSWACGGAIHLTQQNSASIMVCQECSCEVVCWLRFSSRWESGIDRNQMLVVRAGRLPVKEMTDT
jgi:hypothetical protein